MGGIARARWISIAVLFVGVAAAFFLLDQREPWQLRILPWLLIFGYPALRMMRAAAAKS